jgi:Tol biopolymer transport system component
MRCEQLTGFASYGFSDRGTLVYVRAEVVGRDRVLALVDRQGGVERLAVPPGPYVNPRLSPDGTRLLVQTLEDDGRAEIWVWDLSANRQTRQLTTGGNNKYPIWTPDSKRVTFVSNRYGTWSIYWQHCVHVGGNGS